MAIATGQIAVATPGTSVQGPNVPLTAGVLIKALAANTGQIYIGAAAGDNRSIGYEVSPGDQTISEVFNMAELWFDSSVAGGKLSWSKL